MSEGAAWSGFIAIGLAAGLTAGYTAEHLIDIPVLQSVMGALTGLLLCSSASALVWKTYFRSTGAVYFGFSAENAMSIASLCAGAAVLHVLLGWFGGLTPVIANHRAIVLGCLGALWEATSVARVFVAMSRSRPSP